MSRPKPTRRDHVRFCDVEGWKPVRDARGRTAPITFELVLPDGRILRTRVSHPVDRSTYGANLWSHILRDHLQVSEPEFWNCVREGAKPDREMPELPSEALPADLVHLLITRVGLSESEVATMSKAEAVARLNRYWTQGG